MRLIQGHYCKIFLLFSISLYFHHAEGNAQVNCNQINFESVPGASVSDGHIINNQYFDSSGISFKLEDNTFPQIAKVGAPVSAFGTAIGADTIIDVNLIGSYFLTDDGELSGLSSSPLIISFSSPIDSASGVILDIDFEEIFTIQAMDELDSVIVEIIISAGDQGTGDGLATNWGLKLTENKIHSIKFIGERETAGAFGLGFDNLISCQLQKSTSIKEQVNKQIYVYPNPSFGSLTIDLPNSAVIGSLQLYNLMGRKIEYKSITEGHQINIECDYKGTAFLRMVVNDIIVMKKLILK